MSLIRRVLFALALCLLLSNCQLINAALRLAPLLLLADNEGKTGSAESEMQLRGQQVAGKGRYETAGGLLPGPALSATH